MQEGATDHHPGLLCLSTDVLTIVRGHCNAFYFSFEAACVDNECIILFLVGKVVFFIMYFIVYLAPYNLL